MKKSLKLSYCIISIMVICQSVNVAFARQARRDPFVSLIDADGNIRRGTDLFMSTKELLPKIELKGIVWDKKTPVAVINGKVLSEGSNIPVADGGFAKMIILKKINPDSVVLYYNEKEIIIKLRKKGKE